METSKIIYFYYIIILFVIFMIFRELVCWYFKINERIRIFNEIKNEITKNKQNI